MNRLSSHDSVGTASEEGTHYQLSSSTVVHYGSGPGDIGIHRSSDQTPLGPESFGFDTDGNLIVGDRINRRMLLFSRDGNLLENTVLSDVVINDILIDRSRNIYVYSQQKGELSQFDQKGTRLSTLKVEKDVETRGYFHLVGSSIFFADSGEQDVLIGVLDEGNLREPDGEDLKRREGIVTESGATCRVGITKNAAITLEVLPPNGGGILQYQCEVPGVVSATFLGEDKEVNRYVQVESLRAGTEHEVALSVVRFDESGIPMPAIEIKENSYDFWTSKLLAVAEDGSIFQFLPQQGQAKINLYKTPSK